MVCVNSAEQNQDNQLNWNKTQDIDFKRYLAQEGIHFSKSGYYLRWVYLYLRYSKYAQDKIHLVSNRKRWLKELEKHYKATYLIEQANDAIDALLDYLKRNSSKNQSSKNTKTIQSLAHFTPKNRESAPAQHILERDPCDQLKNPETPQSLSWPDAQEKLITVLKTRRYSTCTLKAYSYWFRQFARFLRAKTPCAHEATSSDVQEFLSFLAIQQQVSASSQNQAFNALLFFFRHVLKQELGELKAIRAKQKRRIPVVLSPNEIRSLMQQLEQPYHLIVSLLYGCGLRISEALSLRLQDLDLEAKQLHVFRGKGKKDRYLPLPESLMPDLEAQIKSVKQTLVQDLKRGYDGVFIDDAYLKKHPKAATDMAWQWLFPAIKPTIFQNQKLRHHLHETHVGRAIQKARRDAMLTKRITAHSFRHSYATHLLQANYDILTIQQLLGHSDIRTTMIYLHTLPSHEQPKIRSPLDALNDSKQNRMQTMSTGKDKTFD